MREDPYRDSGSSTAAILFLVLCALLILSGAMGWLPFLPGFTG